MMIIDAEQNSPEWLAARAGVPTASNFSCLITSTGEASKSAPSYAETLAGELYAGQPLDTWEGNKYTEYGHDMEEEAVLAYAMLTGSDPQPVGFCLDDSGRYGCSPDRLIGDDGVLEIKNLPKQHIKTLLYWHKHGRIPTDYVQQVQGQLLVTGRAYCALFFYSPLLPTLVARIEPDQRLQDALVVAIERCITERDRIVQILRAF